MNKTYCAALITVKSCLIYFNIIWLEQLTVPKNNICHDANIDAVLLIFNISEMFNVNMWDILY